MFFTGNNVKITWSAYRLYARYVSLSFIRLSVLTLHISSYATTPDTTANTAIATNAVNMASTANTAVTANATNTDNRANTVTTATTANTVDF